MISKQEVAGSSPASPTKQLGDTVKPRLFPPAFPRRKEVRKMRKKIIAGAAAIR
jgi:hypothetical protein